MIKATVGQCLIIMGHSDVYGSAEPCIVEILKEHARSVALRTRVRKFIVALSDVAAAYSEERGKIIAEYQRENETPGEGMVVMKDEGVQEIEKRLNETVEIEFVPFTEEELGDGFSLKETLRLGPFIC